MKNIEKSNWFISKQNLQLANILSFCIFMENHCILHYVSSSNTEILIFVYLQFSSVTQLCPVLCEPMDCSTLGFSVHHQLPEIAQTHVHWVSDDIQQPHPLLSPAPPAFNISQHQSIFQRGSSLHQVARLLKFQLQHQSFQWISSLLQVAKVLELRIQHQSNEYSELISFVIDWLDLLAV